MAKKQKMSTGKIVLLAAIVIIVVVVAYQKMGGPAVPADEDEGAAEDQQTTVSESTGPAQEDGREAQPLYPDLCYAAGGKPVPASRGCEAGEENIGDVPGFKTPHICCAKR